VRSDGTGLRPVDRGCTGTRTPPACADDIGPAISPDGTRIAYTRQFGNPRHGELAHAGIYTVRIDGSNLRRVTLPPTRSAEDLEPQWPPDGARIVFVRYNITLAPKGKQALFIVNADGSGLRRVTKYAIKAGDGPDWSPDGTQILFRSPQTDDFANCDIWTIHADGTGLRQVTRAAPGVKVYSASFSPDGTAITLGMSGVDGNPDVYRIGSDGSGLTPVTRTPGYDSAPDWGPAVS
jgi:TolB protein